MKDEVLRMEKVTYREQGITYLHNFQISVMAGDIMGILTYNSYGLPALLDILRNNTQLYYGFVYYNGRMVNSWQDMKRKPNRITVIEKHSSLVSGQTVLTNVFVLREGFHQEIIRKKLLRQQLQPFIEILGYPIDPDAMVDDLSPFERVIVELLRAVVAGNRLIILSEINSFISEAEMPDVHRVIRNLAANGFAFLYISLHFEEIMPVCTRAAIMKNGTILAIAAQKDFPRTNKMLYSSQYHKSIENYNRIRTNSAGAVKSGDVVFMADNLTGETLRNFSFQVRRGECLVLQPTSGDLLDDLRDIILGTKKPVSGTMLLRGKKMIPGRDRNAGFIMEDMEQTMLFSGMSYMDNLLMNMDRRVPQVWISHRIKKSVRKELAPMLGEDVFEKNVEELSLSQKYELIFSRLLLQKPDIVFCVQPFQSKDLQHRVKVMELMEKLLDRGIALVIVVVNMADSLALADRVIRIGRHSEVQEYGRRQFSTFPNYVPWVQLYRNTHKDEKDE